MLNFFVIKLFSYLLRFGGLERYEDSDTRTDTRTSWIIEDLFIQKTAVDDQKSPPGSLNIGSMESEEHKL